MESTHMKAILAAVAMWVAASVVFSTRACAAEQALHLSVGGMFLTNSSEQGGNGAEGSTLLTQADLVYPGLVLTGTWFALGGFFQFDKQGANETDLMGGPKIEMSDGPFYLEAGWAPFLQRNFTDRSIASQGGYGWMFGAGVRIFTSPSFFLQFNYKYRIQIIEEQDEVLLSEPIYQRDGYPTMGIGFKF